MKKYDQFINESNEGKYYICINDINDFERKMNITYHKIYKDISGKSADYIHIINDLSIASSYNKKYFKLCLTPEDQEKYDKIERKKKESILKHIDIDPYGEENWETNEGTVVDYLGNDVDEDDAVWCEYDKDWCLKKDAIHIDYMDFYTRPYTKEEREKQDRDKYKKEKMRLKMIDIDPYGEEEWDDTNESAEIDLNTKTYNLREICEKFLDIIKEHKLPNNNLIISQLNRLMLGNRVIFYSKLDGGIDHPPNSQYNRVVEKINVIQTMNGPKDQRGIHVYFHIDVWENRRWLTSIPVDIDKPVMVKERIITKEDPYGEEDWENENKIYESGKYDFEVGDIVICNGRTDSIFFYGEVGIVTDFVNSRATVKFQKRFNNHLHSNGGFDPSRSSYNIDFKCLQNADPEKIEKLKRKKEELRLKYLDIDPYNEEEWEN